MANAYTSIATAGVGTNLVKTGYETLVDFKLRSTPLFRRAVVGKRASALTNPGTTVVFDLYNDLTADANNITNDETIPDSVALPATSEVSVTLNEFGKTVISTLKLRTFTFSDIDPAIANLVARDQAESLDLRVRAAIQTGTNRLSSDAGVPSTQAIGSLDGTDVMKSAIPAVIVAKFRGANVVESMPMNTFGAFIHPDVAHDLRRETGETGWRYPHNNVAPDNLWLANVGVYEGVSYVETPRVLTATDGASSAKVYRSYFFGAQALAEVMAIEPHIIIGPVTDAMQRFRPLSWYGIGGWSVYRNEALYRVETGSSIATF